MSSIFSRRIKEEHLAAANPGYAAYIRREKEMREQLEARRVLSQQICGPINLADFNAPTAKSVKVVRTPECDDRYDIVVAFSGPDDGAYRLAKELSIEQVQAVRQAGTLTTLKPAGLGDGPA